MKFFDYEKILKANRYAGMKNYNLLIYPSDSKINLSMMIEVKRQFDIITSIDYFKSEAFPYFQF